MLSMSQTEIIDEKLSAFKGLEIFDRIISMSDHDRKYSEFRFRSGFEYVEL